MMQKPPSGVPILTSVRSFAMIAIEKLLPPVSRRRGFISRPVLAILVSLGLLGVLVAAVVDRQPSSKKAGSNAEPLVVYCAASNKSVLEAIRADYEKAFGTPLQIQYGASQTLLAALEVAKAGDLYLPADDSYLAMARDRHL